MMKDVVSHIVHVLYLIIAVFGRMVFDVKHRQHVGVGPCALDLQMTLQKHAGVCEYNDANE